MADLFDIDDGIAGAVLEFLPTFRFVLDDLTVLDEAALRNRPVTAATRVLLLLLKAATSGDSRLIEQLSSWDDALRDLVEGPNGV